MIKNDEATGMVGCIPLESEYTPTAAAGYYHKMGLTSNDSVVTKKE